MDTITLRPDLRETLQQDAAQESRSVDEIVNEAVERYLQERQLVKLDDEIAAYEQLHPELRKTLHGKWVAMHNRQVVDHDSDRAALYMRVRAMYQTTPVLIRQVADQASEDIWIRTPSTGRIER